MYLCYYIYKVAIVFYMQRIKKVTKKSVTLYLKTPKGKIALEKI